MHVDKKIMFASVLAAVIVVLPVFSPSIMSADIDSRQKIMVETCIHKGYGEQKTLTEYSMSDAEYLKSCLINLNDAIEKQDKQNIIKYESILHEKGILDGYQIPGFQYPMLLDKMVTDGNISNTLCYFHASGDGIMIFTIGILLGEYLLRLLSNASSIWEAIAIGLVLLPFYVIVLLVTHLIPFRILLPTGIVAVENGSMSTLGLDGYHHVDAAGEQINATVNWFTGITVSIPPINNSSAFLFVSGFALSVVQ